MDETMEERVEHNDPEALKLLGEKKLADGNTQEAKRYLRLAVQLGNTSACYNLGQLYLLDGEPEKALEVFREGQRGGDETCAYSLAEELLKQDDENALSYITEYADNDDEASIRLLINYYDTAGNHKQTDYWKERLKALGGE
ncbi:MAG: hypothetical protein K2M95_06085 [Clostridiales bacterium]|nr:hypothetical protein [Clostridiales bacterium]